MTSVSLTTAFLALRALIWCASVFSRVPSRLRTSGLGKLALTLRRNSNTTGRPRNRVLCTLAAPVVGDGLETKVGAHCTQSCAFHRTPFQPHTCRILLFVFRSRTPRPVPWLGVAAQPRDVSFALHCLRRLAVDCSSNHSTQFHPVPTRCCTATAGCMRPQLP